MLDNKKTKKQLIEELEELRQKVTRLKNGSAVKLNSDITERKQAETNLHKHAMEQKILLNVSQSVSNTLDLESILQTISDGAAELLDIETTAIYLLEKEELLLGATTPPLDPQMPETLRRAQLTDHPRIQEAVTTRTPVLLLDTRQAELSQAEQNIVKSRNLRSLIFLPFLHKEKVIGVLILGTVDGTRKFSRKEVDLCQTISNQLALGVQNARLHTGLIKHANELEDQITERKRAEEANARLSRAIEQADETIVITDAEGTIQYVNPAFEKITGYTAEEAIGQNPRILKSGQHDDAFYKKMWETLSSGKEWHGEIINKKKDGTLYTENAVISPVFDSQGKIINYVAAKNDITETKRLQALESRAERLEMAGTIAGQVAHDFNNLLAPIMAYPEFIHEDLPHDHKAHAYLDAIENAARKIADINQDLLTMGRRGHFNQEVLDLNRVVLQVALEMESQTKTVTVEMKICEDLMKIRGGVAQIHRALTNLMVNAQDAMQDMGQVTVRTENYYVDDTSVAYGRVPKGEYVKLTITDTGCGIPDDIIQKILDPFFSTKTTDKKRSSGLGLSVVDAVMKDHNGFLDLSSRVGHGTSFYLYFPVTREDAGEDESDYLAAGTETVLVVDDDEIQRDVSSQLLKKLGYRVASVESGEKAIEFLRENPQNLVILDMVMPGGIDGAETYRRILEINPHQKAILLSGFSESERVLEAQKLGAGTFVKKPVTRKAIAATVRKELDKVPV